MTREIVFDTETTGVEPQKGDRIVELGAVELIDLIPTGRTFHRYINPERDVPDEVVRVHGLTNAFLSDKPIFSDPDVVDAFLEFVGDAPLVAHNAEFDRRFLNAELNRLGIEALPSDRFVDTLMIARKKYQGAANSLDALCRRFGIDLSQRDKHGALLDSYLLAEVYLQLRGGRERRLAIFDEPAPVEVQETEIVVQVSRRQRPRPLKPLSTDEERAAHRAFVESLSRSSPALWARWLSPAAGLTDQ